MSNTIEFQSIAEPHQLATRIAIRYDTWKQARLKKEQQWKEVRDYVFATDTTTTSNAKLPWRNTTTRPKLCQIRDNLHANYMAALFPTNKWFKWIAGNPESAVLQKAKGIESYMSSKMLGCGFKDFVSKAVLDYIDYGNVFADVEYVTEKYINAQGEEVVSYTGPRPVRLSPLDIVFDITGNSFDRVSKITRELITFGDLDKRIRSFSPEAAAPYVAALARIKQNRAKVLQGSPTDFNKTEGFIADGFGSLNQYYGSQYIELLTLQGDYYDESTFTAYFNRKVVVMDRCYVCEDKELDNWLGKPSLVHAGWRQRPDNLWAMGPLDNLVGMQYRIDHLENLKADIFDLIAFPPTKQKGYVEDWTWGPNERILMDENADVEMLQVPAQVLSADQQIHELEAQMEEMAGAPKEAMGIRSPGEKTAFEVDRLTTAASRMFEAKIGYFEEMFIEPLLNAMLEIARRNLDTADIAKVIDDDNGVVQFLTITREDITARGRLTPIGARHFATKNKLIQNLTNLSQTALFQDQAVSVHFSGWKLAQLIEDALDLEDYNVVQKDVRIAESMETQQLMHTAQEQTVQKSMTPTESPDNADLNNEVNPPTQA
jgi:hypothetical protein